MKDNFKNSQIKSQTKRALGICIGASTIKLVDIDENYKVNKTIIKTHDCNPRKALKNIINTLNLNEYTHCAVTGRKFKDLINLSKITEPEASEYAIKNYIKSIEKKTSGNPERNYNALISLGSENFILYQLNKSGNIINVHTGNKCASGTGEFFLQQIRRMNIKLDEAVSLAENSKPYRVSGRCSVFCKSDCTHALNKGIPIGNVSAGLCDMICEKILELLKSIKKKNIIITGGVTRNSYIINQLKRKIDNIVIPDNAEIFEAFGAAVYALENNKRINGSIDFQNKNSSFSSLPNLKLSQKLVTFKEHRPAVPDNGDECIIGLDVGSTTTKAVLLRLKDNRTVATVYLRTNGNPVKASRECYTSLYEQLNGKKVKINGLGITGSGRQIAGMHALTDGIINEIIAHATAASFFDKDVDTIIEIGGQDAKYTYLVNGVPCDYAMNEACSAGTGSFLEEAAKESLDISYLDIESFALKAENPPNFNDQCAAFISSDIKNASHENINKEDIVAGLVYSICMNYDNRVKSNRKIGERIFMQGGVCYNKAVPMAMASILKKQIIVPPDPGLMGAFGVALEIKNRVENALMEKAEFSLKELVDREVEYGKSFNCAGKSENCDRGCSINRIKINGKLYLFGGLCNKYYNIAHNLSIDPKPLDIVKHRAGLLFTEKNEASGKTIGLIKSFHTNLLYPLYNNFFKRLGFNTVLAEEIDQEGVKMVSSSFCFPAEISHGMFMNLLKTNPDFIFLPQVIELFVPNSSLRGEGREHHCVCMLSQSEPYFLRSAFRNISPEIISPVLDFSEGWETMENEFIKVGRQLARNDKKSREAFRYAFKEFDQFNIKKKELGDKLLKELEEDKSKIAVVLFGRSYNAFVQEANLGIPGKIASRNISVIPYDCLRYDNEESVENMTWAVGQEMLKAASFVKKHPMLFGVYITNFSCGPDSFLIGYFRDIMKTKPSLTLELDSHSADAGINTRIEAFIDIVNKYVKLQIKDKADTTFRMAEFRFDNEKPVYVASNGNTFPLQDPLVNVVLPSMGRTASELISASFRGLGFNSVVVDIPDFSTLMIGRANTSCKECLPLILTASTLLKHVNSIRKDNELTLYFMPTTSGNCRFSQYYVFLKNLVNKKKLENVAFFTLTAENGYAGLGVKSQLRLITAIIIGDIMDDIKNALLVLPENKEDALKIFNSQWEKLIKCFENNCKNIYSTLKSTASELAKIKLKTAISKAKKIILAGEIYVRKDEFSSQELIKRLAARNIITKRSPILEWLYYVDYNVKHQLKTKLKFNENVEFTFKNIIVKNTEKKIKKILSKSGLFEYEKIDMRKIIKTGSRFINPALTGESIIIVGVFFNEILKHVHGVISVGPFACLPTRVTESILSQESQIADNKRLTFLDNIDQLNKFHTLPFLSVEADGNPFPQIVEARIETFSLQVERIYNML